MTEIGARGNGLPAPADVLVGGDDHRHLGGEADSLAQRRLAGVVGALRIEGAERGHRGAQHFHRVRVGDGADDVVDGARQLARLAQAALEVGEARTLRQLALEEQAGGLLESGAPGEVVDGVAPVAELPRPSIDETGGRPVEVDALQAPMDFDSAFITAHRRLLVLRSLRGPPAHPRPCRNAARMVHRKAGSATRSGYGAASAETQAAIRPRARGPNPVSPRVSRRVGRRKQESIAEVPCATAG